MQVLKLPRLPLNARYVHHANECFDWGSFGWVFQSQRIEVAEYRHFIFLNSSVRGPFMPAYVKVSVRQGGDQLSA